VAAAETTEAAEVGVAPDPAQAGQSGQSGQSGQAGPAVASGERRA
jgi:hypothetical protein